VVVGILAVLVLIPTLGLTPQLFAVTSDEEFARVQGLPVRFYNLLVVVLAAVTVTVAMRTVGLLLVSALMVVPVAAARNLVSGFVAALALAMALGVTVSVGGAALSFSLDTAPGALIVVLAIAVFALSWPISLLLARRRMVTAVHAAAATARPDAAEPESAGHPHLHSTACGHESIPHGDHVDYLHDGHRHAAHADHYDEH
jgi:zinc transport system permease protein